MNDDDIYRILKKFPRYDVITSLELLRSCYLKRVGLRGLNERLSELQKLGYISGGMKKDIISVTITPRGLNFVENHKYHLHLKRIEIAVTFALGVLSGALISFCVPILLSFVQLS